MKAIKIEERLGLLGALIVLIGVSSAAGEALAAESADLTTTAIAIHEAAEDTLEIAEQANAEAAAKAAATLAIENGLDLDIRLDDRTSIVLAGHE